MSILFLHPKVLLHSRGIAHVFAHVFAVQTLSYTHIPKQYIAQPSEAKVVRLDLKIPQIKVGYIAGAGDTSNKSMFL